MAIALMAPSFISMNAEAATTNKTVQGVVYDQTSSPLAGADVTVEIWGGYFPGQTVLRSSVSTVTDSSGYYEVTIGSNYWDPHNTINLIVTYDLTQKTRKVEANGDQYQTVDIIISLAIPEFRGHLSLLTIMAGCIVPIIALAARRRKPE